MSEKGLRAPLKIHLEGPAVARNRMPLRDLVFFSQQLQTAVDRIGRVLAGQDTSVRPGRRPLGLEQACALDIVEIRGGSVTIVCDLPEESQATLLEDVGEEALKTLVQGIEGISGQQRPYMPKGYDKGVLLALRESGKLLDRGIERITFDLQAGGEHWAPVYTPETHSRIVDQIQGPVANRRVIEGRLLMGDFKETSFRCRLHPSIGKPISCSFGEEQREAVLAALTRFVRLVGEATESNGEIRTLRIEDIEILDEVEGSGLGADLRGNFADSPSLEDLARQQGVPKTTDFEALLGDFWPEDEDVDEFVATVRDWRRQESDTPDP